MAFAYRFRPIFESSSVVQNRVIMDELYISALKLHHQIQVWVVRERIQHIKSFGLLGCQRLNSWKSSSRFDVLSLINRGEESGVPVENRDGEVCFLTFRDFAATISFDWLKQYLCKIRS